MGSTLSLRERLADADSRELNKVYTNGTLVDPAMLTDDHAGHCISIREVESDGGSNNTFGVCVLDCATSQFDLSVFQDDICRTKLETLMRQIRPKEMLFTKVSSTRQLCLLIAYMRIQGQLSVSTTRLLKAVLPAACLWTSLREVEGFDYEDTMKELASLYPADKGDMDEDDDSVLPRAVPQPIREMAGSKPPIEALGAMIWFVRWRVTPQDT